MMKVLIDIIDDGDEDDDSDNDNDDDDDDGDDDDDDHDHDHHPGIDDKDERKARLQLGRSSPASAAVKESRKMQ